MFKREPERKNLGKFEGTPTYKCNIGRIFNVISNMFLADYPGWAASPREIYGKSPEWVAPKETFGGIPTYSMDYVEYQNSRPRESFRPHQETQIPDVPFQV